MAAEEEVEEVEEEEEEEVVLQVVVEMQEEVLTSSWAPFCGIAPCLRMGASFSCSTWTWRSF